MEQPENGELKDGSPIAGHDVPPVGRVWMYLDDISGRYLHSISRFDISSERFQHRRLFPGRQPAVHGWPYEASGVSGAGRSGPELAGLAAEYGELGVYVVDVCQNRAQHHLAMSYVLSAGEPAAGGRRWVCTKLARTIDVSM
jgi:hypothetical protein